MSSPLDLFFPPRCALCGAPVTCREPRQAAPRLCTACLRETAGWDGFRLRLTPDCVCIAAARYADTAKTVRDFKFRGRRDYAYTLALLMAQAYVRQRRDLPPCDAVTWTPVSFLRGFSRGYDQSRLLAAELGKLLKLPVLPTLRKRRHTPRQSGIEDPGKRAENVRGVYAAREPGEGRHILLADDVVTTGATLREAAAVLEAAGFSCTALCFACTPEKL